ncbi:MAG: formylglycine-generating enzyme family protein [Planctomycetes bacterium]|nr:formylglycine-generating enzyme family protein [Alphaproteobacteria bacterium]MBM3963334.1 formylglycine-generating enzyme family protein [Planctomycetota bacterium]
MNVNWDDAQQYVAWLSRTTGKTYRLLSEAEWEYAAQAGSGREQAAQRGTNQANCDGCGSRWDDRQTAPVGSFAPNAFGLYDMLGNVWEWTADCFGEPTSGECQRRTLRGGAWNAYARLSRSGYRSWFAPSYRFDTIGFRVARAP